MTTATARHADTQREQLHALAAELSSHDGWSREQLLAHQRERLRELLRYAVSASPYYRDALGRDAGEGGVELADLPTLTKHTLMDEFDRIATDPRLRLDAIERHIGTAEPGVPLAGEYRAFSTSGTTGLRGILVYSPEEWTVWLAAHLRLFRRFGVTPETRLGAIGAPSPLHLSRQLFGALTAGRRAAPRLSVTTPLVEIVGALNAYRPEAVITYASVASLLAQEQLEGRLRIQPDVVAVGAEVLTDDAHQRIVDAWGVRPFNVYATTEAPIVAASDRRHAGLYVSDDLVVVEVVDEQNRPVPPGSPGFRVLLTTLVNRALPLVRYELSDSVVLAGGDDPGGLPFSRIAHVDGRSDDILRFPSYGGMEVAVHPYRLRAPFANLPSVRQYQVVYDGQVLRVRVVLSPTAPRETTEMVRSALAREIASAGAVATPIEVEPVAAIEREEGHAAKIKLVKSVVAE